MDKLHSRFLLFLLLCIPTRFAIAYTAKHANAPTLNRMGLLALLPAFGFWYLFLTNSRKTGAETFGANIWWTLLRPMHGTLYLLFALLAMSNNANAYVPLVIDIILGFVAFVVNHLLL